MKMTKIIVAAAILTIGATACSKSAKTESEDDNAAPAAEAVQAPAVVAGGEVTVLADDDLFRPGKAIGAYVVLDFNAVWCGPCKRLNSPMEQAAAEYKDKVAFYAVDFEKLPETAKAFEITDVPVVVMLTPDGTAVRYDHLSPFISDEDLKDLSKEEAAQKIYESICGYVNQMMQ